MSEVLQLQKYLSGFVTLSRELTKVLAIMDRGGLSEAASEVYNLRVEEIIEYIIDLAEEVETHTSLPRQISRSRQRADEAELELLLGQMNGTDQPNWSIAAQQGTQQDAALDDMVNMIIDDDDEGPAPPTSQDGRTARSVSNEVNPNRSPDFKWASEMKREGAWIEGGSYLESVSGSENSQGSVVYDD